MQSVNPNISFLEHDLMRAGRSKKTRGDTVKSQRRRQSSSEPDSKPRPRRRSRLVVVGLILIVAGLASYPWVWQEYRMQQARSLLLRRDTPSARVWLDAALQRDPRRGEAHFLLARTSRREGQMDEVGEHLQRAWDVGYDRQRIEREQWLALAQTGQLDEAEPHRIELLADPRGDAVEICEAYVNGYLRAYRFQEALELLDAWQADFPEDAQPHYSRALVWSHLMRTADSVEEYELALQLDPNRIDARVQLANQLTSLHRYDEAGEHYRVCLEQDPKMTEARLGYAFCLLEQGEVERPERWFRETLEESPGNIRARVGLGTLALMDGRDGEAAEVLENVVRLEPTNRTARYKLASALQSLGRGEEAAGHFEYVSQANKGLARVQQLLESLRTNPDQIGPRLDIGKIILEYDSSSEGVAWIQSILEMDPQHAPAHQALAEYYDTHAMPDLAARHWRMIRQTKEDSGS